MLQFWKIVSKIFKSWIKNLFQCPIILIAFKHKLQDISTRPIWSLLLMGRTTFWKRIKNTSGSFLSEQEVSVSSWEGSTGWVVARMSIYSREIRNGGLFDRLTKKAQNSWDSGFHFGSSFMAITIQDSLKLTKKHKRKPFIFETQGFYVSKCLKSLKIITNLLHTFFPSSLIFKKLCLTPWSMLVCVFIHLANIESNCSKYVRHRSKQTRQWFISSGSQTSGWGRQIIKQST